MARRDINFVPDRINSGWISCIQLSLLLIVLFTAAPLAAQWRVGEIRIEGNEQVGGDRLRKVLSLKRGEPYAEWMIEDDRSRLIALYRSRGFLQAEVDEFAKEIDLQNQRVDVTVTIREGKQTILASIQTAGNIVFASTSLVELVDVRTGRPLDARQLNVLKQRIIDRYHQHGYLHVRVHDRFYFPQSERQAEVYFDIDEGPQVYVGQISISGNDNIKTSVVHRALEIRPGETYSEEKMRRSKANLYRIGILNDIRHELIFHGEDSSVVDVEITMVEGEFRSVGVGGGLGDVDGLRGWLEWGHYNLADRALSLLQLTRITYQPFEQTPAYEYSYSSSLTLRQPYFLNSKIEASTTGLFEKVSYSHHDEEKLAVNILLRNMITQRRELSLLLELNQRNIFNVDTSTADQSTVDNRGNNITNLISPLAMFDLRDDRFNPQKGVLVVARSTLAGGPLLPGSISFYRFSIETSYLYPVYRLGNNTPLIVAFRVKLGTVREFGGTASVPPTEAFNIGGAKSLRGYSELSLGPLNDRNVPGNVLVESNFELRFPVWSSFGGVLFLDAANVFDELHFDDRFRLLTTAGIGARYHTPIGPLRIDFAFKLNNFRSSRVERAGDQIEEERDSWGRIHFGIGHAF
ncbi:MAG: BamA/TamA family outer membrane protein [Candidatus Glassbacteria bacterium]|nr:BamA/TamA family outer membrane protein [Candidatus Glassbacteria bacterium]